jgi:type I restriction-modification system DNA methylase subunit
MPSAHSLESFKAELTRLTSSFRKNLSHLKSEAYDESALRNDFLNPFWRALGWDVENMQGVTQPLREVQIESRVDIAGRKKRADYLFRTDGIDRFVCEAKNPREDLSGKDAYQAQRYAFNLKLLISALTNFESIKLFVVGGKPDQAAPWDVCKQWNFLEYEAKAQELWDLFSRDNVASGSLDKFVASLPKKTIKGKARQGWHIVPDRVRTVDADFLAYIEEEREELAKDLVRSNKKTKWTDELLNECVQRILDRILFVRICEDRDIDTGRSLELMLAEWEQIHAARPTLYSRLVSHFNILDQSFNGALFRKGHPSERLLVSDKFLAGLVRDLSSEDSPYLFSTLPVEILGSVYEQFIGKVVRLTNGGNVKVELKPEVRNAGGIYYTPSYVVEYIVGETVGKALDGKTPREITSLRFLDPACGSGSFLIRVFENICQYHLQWFQDNPKQQHKDLCYRDGQSSLHLTTHLKRQIMLNNIFGLDLDYQAVEVTMLSLYLKILEGETRTTLGQQRGFFPKETFLPDLSANIKCGNSLIGSRIAQGQLSLLSAGQELQLDSFDWQSELPQVMKSGGFDVILGNPPYGASLTDEEASYLSDAFIATTKDLDTYGLFMEQATNKTKPFGYVSMIVPTGWYSGPKFSKLRKFVATQTDPKSFVNLPYDVFKDAWVDTTIFVARKRKVPSPWPRTEKCDVTIRTFAKRHKIRTVHEFHESLSSADLSEWFATGGDEYLTYADARTTHLLQKLSTNGVKVLGDCADVQRGVTPFNLSDKKRWAASRPAFDGTVRRYTLERGPQCFIRFDDSLAEPKPERYFLGSRLLLRELISRQFRLQAMMVEEDFVTNKSMQSILCIEGGPDLEYLLGCLNSRLISWYFLHRSNIAQRDDFPKIVLKESRSLPIPVVTGKNRKEAEGLSSEVKQMLALQAKAATSQSEHESDKLKRQIAATDSRIDQMVYSLYGLNEKEVAVIEKSESSTEDV